MSFADSHSSGGGGEGNSLLSQLSSCISQMHTNNQVLRRLLKSPPDRNRRASLEELRVRNESSLTQGSELVEKIGVERKLSSREEVTANKLSRDLRNVVRDYQEVMRMFQFWGMSSKSNGTSSSDSVSLSMNEPTEKTSLLLDRNKLSQSQLLLEEEEEQKQKTESRAMESNEQFMLSRQEAVQRLHSQFQEVNSIFRDIAVVIADQGAQLDQVEADTANAQADVRRGKREIRKRDSKITARRKIFFLALVIVAFAIALFLIVMLN